MKIKNAIIIKLSHEFFLKTTTSIIKRMIEEKHSQEINII